MAHSPFSLFPENDHSDFCFAFLRRISPTTAKPIPAVTSVAGSGTEFGGLITGGGTTGGTTTTGGLNGGLTTGGTTGGTTIGGTTGGTTVTLLVPFVTGGKKPAAG